MDIYGYPAYSQYSQADDQMAKMLAHQTLSTSLPYNRAVSSEPHVMPAPSGIPWNIQGLSWGMSSPPQLVQFTALPQQQFITEPKYTTLHCKRKTVDIEPAIPAKVLITEEKMAAHLNSLHISTDYTTHTLASQEVMDVGMESTTNVSDKLKGHTIVLSEEIKKLQDEPLLPAALIERLEKPCMSLVVWKPKENIIEKKLKEEKDNQIDTEEDEVKRRNGVLVPEHTMDVEM